MIFLLLFSTTTFARPTCSTEPATAAFDAGFTAQKAGKSATALEQYQKCLEEDDKCTACTYEIGWTWWALAEYGRAVETWEQTLALDPNHAAAAEWLPAAKDRFEGRSTTTNTGWSVRVPIGTSSGSDGPLQLTLAARFQNFDHKPSHEADHYEQLIYSPKSARFAPSGDKVYVNSLEGYTTVVFDPKSISRSGVIEHTFDANDKALFADQSTVFQGKPVESTFTHDGKYLWEPYYRRDFDVGATSPSAVAVVDTSTDAIVRVFPTGPIPKYVAGSPDGKWLAITHWGDNTLMLVDTSGATPADWSVHPDRLVVEKVLGQAGLEGQNRDSACGFCLRGTMFTPDGEHLLVARMGNGGIAGFSVADWSYMGTVTGEPPTPRHLVTSPDGEWLYISSNRSGKVSRIPLTNVINGLQRQGDAREPIEGWDSLSVGSGARTIEVTRDGRWIFVAVNGKAQLVAIDVASWDVVARVRTDAYTVGLDVSPDGKQIWTTSQGRSSVGGNSVNVFEVTYK